MSPTIEIEENPKKWEIEVVGQFLSKLYFQQIISHRNNWTIDKQTFHAEFCKFINNEENAELCSKLHDLFDDSDIERLLYHTKYLTNSCELSDIDTDDSSDDSDDLNSDSSTDDFIYYSTDDCNDNYTDDVNDSSATESVVNNTDDTGNNKESDSFSGFYHIDSSAVFDYWSKKIENYDEKPRNKENMSTIKISPLAIESENNTNVLCEFTSPDLYENAISYPLQFKSSKNQTRNPKFFPTNIGCYICQLNFNSADKFEQHVTDHGNESNFKLLNIVQKCSTPIFALSYKLCKESHYFCFVIESKLPEVVIEKIIIVQSRSMYYADNARVPYDLPADGKAMFFVDCHLFKIHLEQPIIVVCHNKNKKHVRIIEQHHFKRSEAFPEVNFSVHSNRLEMVEPFERSWNVKQYLPHIRICRALFYNNCPKQLYHLCKEFKDYHCNGNTFTPQNMCFAMKTILEVEDVYTMLKYRSLIQRNVTFDDEYANCYSFQMKLPDDVEVGGLLSNNEDVLIIPNNDRTVDFQALLSLDLLMLNYNYRVFRGEVREITDGRITIYSYKKLFLHQSFMVIFRPIRCVVRLQYQALTKLQVLPQFIKEQFLFPEHIPKPVDVPNVSLNLVNKSIYNNPEQLQAVQNIVNGANTLAPYIIYGPPGTGKTTTIVEAILQLYLTRPDTKIFITAGSNSACDEIAKRLCSVISKLKDHRRSIARIYARSYQLYVEHINELLWEYSNLYDSHFYPNVETLHEYRIVICTMSIAGRLATKGFGNGVHTHVFMDEVTASTEVEANMVLSTTLSRKARLILSGDHKQLGPVVKSSLAIQLGLEVSLMERLLKRKCFAVDEHGNYNRSIQTRLRLNYRSHPEIVRLYNTLYYNNELKSMANEDVTLLCNKWHRSLNETYPIIFHCVYGTAEIEYSTNSLFNQQEVDVVMNYVKDLMYFGVNGQKITQADIGIISPYKSQYQILQQELVRRNWYNIETGAVETFQGKEKTIIIASFVRSYTKDLGFLHNPRRLNVTLSRPKSFLVLVGNPTTLSANSDFKYVINECRRHNTLVDPDYYDPTEVDTIASRLAKVIITNKISQDRGEEKTEENKLKLKASSEAKERIKSKVAAIKLKLSTRRAKSTPNTNTLKNRSTVTGVRMKTYAEILKIHNSAQYAKTSTLPSVELNIDSSQEDPNSDPKEISTCIVI